MENTSKQLRWLLLNANWKQGNIDLFQGNCPVLFPTSRGVSQAITAPQFMAVEYYKKNTQMSPETVGYILRSSF